MKLAAREETTVLLDGQGADETLAGYLHYFRPLFLGLFRTDRARLRREVEAYRKNHGDAYPISLDRRFRLEARRPELLRFLGRIRRRFTRPSYLRDLAPEFVRAHRTDAPPFVMHRSLDAALRHATTEQGLVSLLRFADRSSMAFAREVRLPFLSHELVEFLFTLPDSMKIGDGETKRILRASMQDVLPPELAARKDKLGFRPPQAAWMAHPAIVERVAAAKADLRERGILTHPVPDRDWAYLMASTFLSRSP
jgi:asparagine synthase (glutamine-hydrolysing)